jgi:selenide,water dikinase
MRPLQQITHPDLWVGTETGDDAAVWRRPDGRALVATVDFFAPIVDDAGSWGAIGAANSASDVYAMGGRPLFALNVVAWPRDRLPLDLLSEVLAGAAATAAEGGWVIAGGHTVDGPEPMFGQAVVGELDPGVEPLTNLGARPGDVLVLTKPLGTGLLATAHKRLAPREVRAGGRWHDTYEAAVRSMRSLNAAAGAAAVRAGAHACTDVTGFGLVGHLHKMMAASGTSAELHLASLPELPGARHLVDDGFVPGGTHRNLAYVGESLVGGSEHDRLLVADPQTSGGLLVAVPASGVAEVEAVGGRVVGRVTPGEPGVVRLVG